MALHPPKKALIDASPLDPGRHYAPNETDQTGQPSDVAEFSIDSPFRQQNRLPAEYVGKRESSLGKVKSVKEEPVKTNRVPAHSSFSTESPFTLLAYTAPTKAQRPRPKATDSFKRLLRRNLINSSSASDANVAEKEERRLRQFVEDVQPTVRPLLAGKVLGDGGAGTCGRLSSSFSPDSTEFPFSAPPRRTPSNSSLGSGGGRIQSATSSFLRRLRSRKNSISSNSTPRAEHLPKDRHVAQRSKVLLNSGDQDTSRVCDSLEPDLSRTSISRGLYKPSSNASVQSYRGTDDSQAASSTNPSLRSHSSVSQDFTSNLREDVRGNTQTSSHYSSSVDLPIIEGSPPVEKAAEEQVWSVDTAHQQPQPAQKAPPSSSSDYPQPSSSPRHSSGTAESGSVSSPASKRGHLNVHVRQAARSYDYLHDQQGYESERSDQTAAYTSMAPTAEKSSTGGGWMSRFVAGKKEKGDQSPAAAQGALLDRFTLEKKGSRDEMGQELSGNGSKDLQRTSHRLDMQDEHEMAAQHIARQQRAANDAKLSNLLDGKQKKAPTQKASMTSIGSPTARLEEYRQATRESNVHGNKLDRLLSRDLDTATPPSPAAQRMLHTSSVSSSNDEASCPVCLELLSFRLAGEKAHIVPLCGHALHHACFTAVYGAPELVLAAQESHDNPSSPGMCGVCRRLIVLAEEREARQGKVAGMMGVDDGRPEGRDAASERPRGTDKRSNDISATDDPLIASASPALNGRANEQHAAADNAHKMSLGALDGGRLAKSQQDRFMVLPIIKVRPEFETVYRKERQGTDAQTSGRQNVVCVVSVEIPPRRRIARMEEDETLWQQKTGQYLSDRKGKKPSTNQERFDEDDEIDEPEAHRHSANHQQPSNQDVRRSEQQREQRQESSGAQTSDSEEEEGFSYGATPAAVDGNGVVSFKRIVDDLRTRIVDWKGHSVERFGKMVLFDSLGVRQDSVVRTFYVYLFNEALLCVSEERKKERGLARLNRSFNSEDSSGSQGGSSAKAPLKLKGRIWIRHIRRCQDTEIDKKPCLSIKLDDEALDHFVLCFKDTTTRDIWRESLSSLLEEHRKGRKAKGKGKKESEMTTSAGGAEGSFTSTNGSSSRRTEHSSPATTSQSSFSSPSTSTQAHGASIMPPARPSARGEPIMPSFLTSLPSHQQWSASGGLDPGAPVPEMLPHTPLDLVIMISVPSVTGQPAVSSATLSSSAALKLRLIRSTLDFIIANVGSRDRIALVAYNVGVEGLVRRTALLNVSKAKSLERLEQFVDTIGKPWEGPGEDPFREDINRLGGKTERTDTVTAVNVGFDIVLQRKSRNPTTGMLLINDTADAPKRGQMDLIMARAEAANVPVHCFGFGKSHDPSSLWLISNHTRGSYTFVKEWYQLRECVAGCLGALMSIALTDVKVHVSVPSDNHFRVRKVAGCTGSIISSSGKDVDLELGEMRFGECKELFLELELDFTTLLMQHNMHKRHQRSALTSHYEKGSATDDFMQRLGLPNLTIADPTDDQSFGENGGVERSKHDISQDQDEVDFVDDVAVLEVHCGCRDPSIGVGASRLPDPCVLTLEVDASSVDPATEADGLARVIADPVVTRRRMEILVSDMITRCLLLVSRRNHAQALTILLETRKIVDTVLQSIPLDLPSPPGKAATNRLSTLRDTVDGGIAAHQTQAAQYATQTRSSHARKQRELLNRRTAVTLMAMLDDLDVLIDGLETGKAISFERSERNFGAQQAMVLRDQKGWTSRSDTEWQYFKMLDNGPSYAALAAHYAANFGR